MSAMTDEELEKLARKTWLGIFEKPSDAPFYGPGALDSKGTDAILTALRAVRDASAPPLVDATLWQIANGLRASAKSEWDRGACVLSREISSFADAISAHARKANEGAVNVETARTLCVLDIVQPPDGMELCSNAFQEYVGGKLNELIAIVRAESAAPGEDLEKEIRKIVAEEPCDNDGRGCPTIGQLEALLAARKEDGK